jgi:hypothetical protein
MSCPASRREFELGRFAGLAMAEERLGFARIMVAVVAEENNFAADLRLQPAGRLDFGNQEPFREKPARLLAETNDRRGGHEGKPVGSTATGCSGGLPACR